MSKSVRARHWGEAPNAGTWARTGRETQVPKIGYHPIGLVYGNILNSRVGALHDIFL